MNYKTCHNCISERVCVLKLGCVNKVDEISYTLWPEQFQNTNSSQRQTLENAIYRAIGESCKHWQSVEAIGCSNG